MMAGAVGVEGALKPLRLAFYGIQSGSSIACKIEGGRERLRMRDTGRKKDDLSFVCRRIAGRRCMSEERRAFVLNFIL